MACSAAKLLHFTSLASLLMAGVGASAKGVLPDFECGEYEVLGHLGRNSGGHLILTLRHPSRARAELLVIDAPSPATEDRLGTQVVAVVDVNERIVDYGRAEVSVLRYLPLKAPATGSPGFTRLRAHNCAVPKGK
jgi:hypothetical protein